MKTLFAFDLDDTLIKSDPKLNEKEGYKNVSVLKQLPLYRMFEYYSIQVNTEYVIITNRPRDAKKDISRIFGIEGAAIHTRPDNPEFIEPIPDHKLKAFFQWMHEWKAEVLRRYAKEYDYVFYFDDLGLEMLKAVNLPENVQVLLPCTKKNAWKYKWEHPKLRELTLKAMVHWGIQAQEVMMIEEMAELTQLLAKHANKRIIDQDHFYEELADVQLMLNQLIHHYNCQEEVDKYIGKKINRTLAKLDKKMNDFGERVK